MKFSAKWIGFHLGWLGFAVAMAIAWTVGDPSVAGPSSYKSWVVGGTAWMMASWWMTEALPLAATSLIPLAVLPALQVVSAKDIAPTYFSQFIVLLMGGFMLAKVVERWGLHRRIALAVLLRVGTSPRRLLWGFMAASALLSMWISNTATVLMMLPIAAAVSSRLHGRDSGQPSAPRPFDTALLLGVAYAGSIGGLATPIGTPPNVIFLSIYATVPGARPIGFLNWMIMALPVVLALLALTAFWLERLAGPSPAEAKHSGAARQELRDERDALGPMSVAERRVAWVFAITAFAWVFRSDISIGSLVLPGWETWLGFPAGMVHDSTVAIVSVLALFLLSSGYQAPEHATEPRPQAEPLLDWQTAASIPWGLLLLFGGGLALSMAFSVSGLSHSVGDALAALSTLPSWLLVLLVTQVVIFLTEVTSNTATASVLLPILAAASAKTGIDPLLLMLPATLAASCAFMLPVATAPNAIVFGTGLVSMRDMVRAGLFLNVAGGVIVALWCWAAGLSVL